MPAPTPPLEKVGPKGFLQICLLRDVLTGCSLIVMREDAAISVKEIEVLGLTRREAEVLTWVSQGKTNPEIAILCDISERTVQKHLEHIYQKLRVETRTAAARQALSAHQLRY